MRSSFAGMRAAIAGLLIVGLGSVGSSAPAAAHTDLIAFSSNRSPWFADHVFTADTTGRHLHVLGIGADPALSPDGKKIAYRRDQHIWVMNRDGSHAHPVAFSIGALDGLPEWSPDGGRLAYAGQPSPSAAAQFVVLDLRSRRKTRLPGATSASWSPDGRRLAYIDSGQFPGALVVAKADGSSSKTLLTEVEGAGTPAWSPDGKWLAYTRVGRRWQDLYRIRPDGSGETRLTRDVDEQTVLSWSPDGRWLAYLRADVNGRHESVRLLGVRPLHIRPMHPRGESNDDWSSDGRALLVRRIGPIRIFNAKTRTVHSARTRPPAGNFTEVGWFGANRLLLSARLRGNDFDIYTIRPDASGLRRLTSDPAQEYQPTWSPDGTRLAFVRSGPRDRLCVIVLGRRRRSCFTSSFAIQRPAWSPTGGEIAYVCDDRLCSIRPNGRDFRVIEQDRPVSPGGLSWAPDGHRLVFASTPPASSLWLLDVRDASVAKLTSGSNDSQPAWSPDGMRIVFRRGYGIAEVDPLIGEPSVRNVLPGYLHPAWSADSRRLAFDNDDRLFVANADGGGISPLTRPIVGSRDVSPAWRP